MKKILVLFVSLAFILLTSNAYSQSFSNKNVQAKKQNASTKKVSSANMVSATNHNSNNQNKVLAVPGNNKTDRKFIRKSSKKLVSKDINKQ